MLLFPFPLSRNNENGNIEKRILLGCAPCTMIVVYILPDARKRLLQKLKKLVLWEIGKIPKTIAILFV